jgi:hypothetical protein
MKFQAQLLELNPEEWRPILAGDSKSGVIFDHIIAGRGHAD